MLPKKSALALACLALLASCQSRQTSKPVATTASPAVSNAPQNLLPPNFKFSFYISGSGNEDVSDTGTKPYDSWTMDTMGEVNVRVSRRTVRQNFNNQNAVAALDPPDMDSLRLFIQEGKLFEIDSTDLSQACASNERYVVRIVPLSATIKPVSLSFDACATDFNLLLQPQRRYFKRLMGWWERMRIKYRPGAS